VKPAISALGKYEILQQLGAGSMGMVYRARDTVLDRYVALKVMRTESESFPEMSERFSREARACAKLHHQNIVAIYDFGEAENSSYIVMELLEGSDWRAILKGQISLGLGLKVDLMAQVCDGLAHAHQAGIVHRDLKPSNFFVHLGNQAKILDFGLVKLSTSVLTRTGMVLGTPNYMAPEQITGQKCDAKSDLFSAAIVFYEFLTGSHPFQAPFIPKRIVTDLPDPIGEIAPGLPILLQDAISRGLEKDPEQRFPSAEEFALALRDAADGLDEDGYSGLTGSNVATFDGDTQSIALDATVAMPVSKPGKE
jgi:serine/threonine protein kinase